MSWVYHGVHKPGRGANTTALVPNGQKAEGHLGMKGRDFDCSHWMAVLPIMDLIFNEIDLILCERVWDCLSFAGARTEVIQTFVCVRSCSKGKGWTTLVRPPVNKR